MYASNQARVISIEMLPLALSHGTSFSVQFHSWVSILNEKFNTRQLFKYLLYYTILNDMGIAIYCVRLFDFYLFKRKKMALSNSEDVQTAIFVANVICISIYKFTMIRSPTRPFTCSLRVNICPKYGCHIQKGPNLLSVNVCIKYEKKNCKNSVHIQQCE